jgi:hypothetical protein
VYCRVAGENRKSDKEFGGRGCPSKIDKLIFLRFAAWNDKRAAENNAAAPKDKEDCN